MRKFHGDALTVKYALRDLGAALPRVLQHTPGRRVCVQAGGNLGVYVEALAAIFDTVYTFEPDRNMFCRLMQNTCDSSNVVAMQAALGDRPRLVGTSRSRRDTKRLPVHDGLTHVSGPGTVPTLSLDDLCLENVDLVWLDVEGHEYYALLGMINTLKVCRPTVVVEVNEQCMLEGLRPDDVRTLLRMEGMSHAFTIGSDEVFTW